MRPAITVENLSKQYRIGVRTAANLTLREAFSKVSLPSRQEKRANDTETAGTLWALRDITFQVQPGEAVALIGPNGAGKSTLLKILSRITRPTQGRAQIYGRVASMLEVGSGFHPDLTGRENIFLDSAILGMSRHEIARKFDEIVEFSGVEKFLETPVKYYSSGMYMRLAFSVAAHVEPEILILDEVLAVGDAAFQKKCLTKMTQVINAGRTLLFVSHNMAAVQSLCSRGLLFQEGRLIGDADVKTIIDTYTTGS